MACKGVRGWALCEVSEHSCHRELSSPVIRVNDIAWGHSGTMVCDGELVGIWVPVGRYNMSDAWFGPLIIIDDHARLYRTGRRYRLQKGQRVIRSNVSGPVDVADLSEKEADELRNRLREMLNWRKFDD